MTKMGYSIIYPSPPVYDEVITLKEKMTEFYSYLKLISCLYLGKSICFSEH